MLLPLLGKRLLQAIPVIIGVSVATFALLNLLPGNPALAILGTQATPQSLAALNSQLGLDHPLVDRYWTWVTQALHGNLGNSLSTQQPVAHLIWQRAPVTVELVALAFIIALAVALPVALLSAYRPNHSFDRFTSVGSVVGLSAPAYLIALLLSLVFAVHARILPVVGFVSLWSDPAGNLRDLLLPAVTLSLGLFSTYVRLLRADLIDQMTARDYIVAGRAKGLTNWQVLMRHALRNASFGLITVVGVNIGTLLGATVVVESIFGIPGLGGQLLQAINNRDATIVQGTVLFMAVAVVLANLLTDIVYAALDPRIRYGRNEN